MVLNLDIDTGFVLCYKLVPPRQKDIACPKPARTGTRQNKSFGLAGGDVVRRVAGLVNNCY
ncbi:MAG: hypothetical protein ACE5GU_11195 [Candidatus Scalinduaceae bacterium]